MAKEKNKRSILLVEDEHLIAIREAHELEQEGYKVHHVVSGEEAVKTALDESFKIDLILMDIDLGPGISGTQAAEIILGHTDIPILFLSSHSEPEFVEKTEKITSYGYVLKSTGITVLAASIKMVFRLFESRMKEKKHNEALRKSEEDIQTLAAELETTNEELETVNEELQASNEELQASNEELNETLLKLQQASEAEKTAHSHLISVMDAVTEPVYVADTETHELLFFNRALEQALGPPGAGRKKCYKYLQNRDTPCPFCTNDKILGDNFGKTWEWEFRNEVNQRWYRCIDRAFIWPDGRLVKYEMAIDITDIKKAIEFLHENEERYRAVFEGAIEGILICDPETKRLRYGNPAIHAMFGYGPEEIETLSVTDIHPAESIDEVLKFFDTREQSYIHLLPGIPCMRKDGSIFYADIKSSMITIDRLQHIVGFFTDITKRKQDDERISDLLDEKDIILREAHHRLKNNMTMVHSLLYLQSNSCGDSFSRDVLIDAANRIKGMQLIFDRLYSSENFHETNIKNFLSRFIEEILSIYRAHVEIETDIGIDEFILSSKKLQSVAIIINELITNSIKYAFSDGRKGLITVSAAVKGDTAVISFQDNGPGLPEPFDINNPPGFGLNLAVLLTQQLKGTLEYSTDNGAVFTITFPAQ